MTEEQSINEGKPDKFLDGRVLAFQPKFGFRTGSDSVLLGAAIQSSSSQILELGCGAGIATICALADLQQSHATLVDFDSEAIAYTTLNLKHNGLDNRATPLCLDVTAKGVARTKTGVKTDFYTTVIANPPFFQTESGTPAAHVSRDLARNMPAGELEKWVITAAASAAPKGEAIFIYTIEALPQILSAFENRFGNISILPIAPRPGQNAARMLVRGIKGSRAPLAMLPPFVMHGEEGREFSPVAEAIFRGRGRLDW